MLVSFFAPFFSFLMQWQYRSFYHIFGHVIKIKSSKHWIRGSWTKQRALFPLPFFPLTSRWILKKKKFLGYDVMRWSYQCYVLTLPFSWLTVKLLPGMLHGGISLSTYAISSFFSYLIIGMRPTLCFGKWKTFLLDSMSMVTYLLIALVMLNILNWKNMSYLGWHGHCTTMRPFFWFTNDRLVDDNMNSIGLLLYIDGISKILTDTLGSFTNLSANLHIW